MCVYLFIYIYIYIYIINRHTTHIYYVNKLILDAINHLTALILIYLKMAYLKKLKFSAAITPVLSVTWSFRNHSHIWFGLQETFLIINVKKWLCCLNSFKKKNITHPNLLNSCLIINNTDVKHVAGLLECIVRPNAQIQHFWHVWHSVVKSTDRDTIRYWNFKNVHFPLNLSAVERIIKPIIKLVIVHGLNRYICEWLQWSLLHTLHRVLHCSWSQSQMYLLSPWTMTNQCCLIIRLFLYFWQH